MYLCYRFCLFIWFWQLILESFRQCCSGISLLVNFINIWLEKTPHFSKKKKKKKKVLSLNFNCISKSKDQLPQELRWYIAERKFTENANTHKYCISLVHITTNTYFASFLWLRNDNRSRKSTNIVSQHFTGWRTGNAFSAGVMLYNVSPAWSSTSTIVDVVLGKCHAPCMWKTRLYISKKKKE